MVMLLVTAGIEKLEGSRQIQNGNNETHPWSQQALSNSKAVDRSKTETLKHILGHRRH